MSHNHSLNVGSCFFERFDNHIFGPRIFGHRIIRLGIVSHPYRRRCPDPPTQTIRHRLRSNFRPVLRRRNHLLHSVVLAPVIIRAVMRLRNPFSRLVIHPTDTVRIPNPLLFHSLLPHVTVHLLPDHVLHSLRPVNPLPILSQMTPHQPCVHEYRPPDDATDQHIPQHILRQNPPGLHGRPPRRLIPRELQPPSIRTVIVIDPRSDVPFEFRISTGIGIVEQSRGVEGFVISV
mmetsp:Transcript_8633/g.17875  ORF Transcript_8633/g.17875 Transcript_8633/m.17875 type:complete len:233 (-) Transcript_8633:1219-1917(-)